MKKFELILANYEATKAKIKEKIKIANLDVKEVARKIGSPVSRTYSKLNGRYVLIHKDYLAWADMLRIDKKSSIEYESFL